MQVDPDSAHVRQAQQPDIKVTAAVDGVDIAIAAALACASGHTVDDVYGKAVRIGLAEMVIAVANPRRFPRVAIGRLPGFDDD